MAFPLLASSQAPPTSFPSKEDVQTFFFRAFEQKFDFGKIFQSYTSQFTYCDAVKKMFLETADQFCWIAKLIEIHEHDYKRDIKAAKKASIEGGAMDMDEDDELEIDEEGQVGGPGVEFNTVTKIFQGKAPRRGDLKSNRELKGAQRRRANARKEHVKASRKEHREWRGWFKRGG
ncbi:hypothetical protein TWF281_008054 [Arthrobotrys megalospora]